MKPPLLLTPMVLSPPVSRSGRASSLVKVKPALYQMPRVESSNAATKPTFPFPSVKGAFRESTVRLPNTSPSFTIRSTGVRAKTGAVTTNNKVPANTGVGRFMRSYSLVHGI